MSTLRTSSGLIYHRPTIQFAPRTIRHQLDRQHDGGSQQGDREQEPVLLEIGQGDQRDQQGGDDVAQGDRSEQQGRVQYYDNGADKAFGRLERGGLARMNHLLEISQYWHSSLY